MQLNEFLTDRKSFATVAKCKCGKMLLFPPNAEIRDKIETLENHLEECMLYRISQVKCERCGTEGSVALTYSVDDDKEMNLCVFCRTLELYCAIYPFEPKEEA